MPQTSLATTRAIVFDVFGTLANIGEKRRPFGQLLRLLEQAGREPSFDDARRIMSNNVGLAGAVQLFGFPLPAVALAALELDLYRELATIQLYPETLKTLTALREAGFKLGLCSNLAAPYAVAVKLLLPFELDAYAWSFEVGAIKPEAAIYESICTQLACVPAEVVMIGDTVEADYMGPRRLGMQSFYLCRRGKSSGLEHLRSLDELLPFLLG